jgi:hypothetical protein|tara:strand:+ start:63 stop:677 length:615 start_codon:yes stop_codon:yes gene_type:complete
MIEKKKISRIIPFGYEKVNGKDLLRPIKDQLKHLNTAKNLYKDGNTSLRRVSQWLTDNTGRYISHVGLRKIINKEKLNNNKATVNIKLQNNWQGIFGLNHARIGDVVEHIAITRLLKSGWEVFKNISSVGPIDICIFNIKKNKFYYIDIKSLTRSYRSIEHFLSGMCVERLTSKQKKLGVKLAYYFDDRVYIIINRKAKQVICI